MFRLALILGFATLTACGKKGDDSASNDCGVSVGETVPADGATNAYYRNDIEFALNGSDKTATVAVTGPSGDVPGTSWTNDDGSRVYFTPDAPYLSPSTNYTATITHCAGDNSISFTTSDLGGGMTDVSVVSGKTYVLNLGSARFVQPENIGAILGSQISQDILVSTTAVTDSSITMIGAMSEVDVTAQDYCSQTMDFPTADFTAHPFFSVGPGDTTLVIAGQSVDVMGFELSATFAPDGSYFGGGELAGKVDTRPLVPILDPEGADSAICDIALGFGVNCEACEDGGMFCLTLLAKDIQADWDSSLPPVTVVDQSNCNECCDSNDTKTCSIVYDPGSCPS